MPLTTRQNLIPPFVDRGTITPVFVRSSAGPPDFQPEPGTQVPALHSSAAGPLGGDVQCFALLSVNLTQFGRAKVVLRRILAASHYLRDSFLTGPLPGPAPGAMVLNLWTSGMPMPGNAASWLDGVGAAFHGDLRPVDAAGRFLHNTTKIFEFRPDIDLTGLASFAVEPALSTSELPLTNRHQAWIAPAALEVDVTPIVRLTVRVVDDAGVPLPSSSLRTTSVTVKDPGGIVLATAGVTSPDGVVSFPDLVADRFTVVVTTGDLVSSQTKTFQIVADRDSQLDAVFFRPRPSFTFLANADLGILVVFDGTQSLDPDGTIRAAFWNFGDGATTSGLTASHAYAVPGLFTVTLTLVDDAGLFSSLAKSVRVLGPGIFVVTQVDNGTAIGNVPVNIFDNATGQLVVSGTTDANGALQVTLPFAGRFVASGTFKGQTNSVVFDAPNPAGPPGARIIFYRPHAAFAAPPSPPVSDAGVLVTFNASASTDLDGTVKTALWDFADGSTGIGLVVTHRFANPGTYLVSVRAVDNTDLESLPIGTSYTATQIPSRIVPSVSLGPAGELVLRGHLKVMGDVDGNGKVDILDASNVAFAFGSRAGDPLYNPEADFDQNGTIDIIDSSTVAFLFGARIPAAELDGQTIIVEALVAGIFTPVASLLTVPGPGTSGLFSLFPKPAAGFRAAFAGNAIVKASASPVLATVGNLTVTATRDGVPLPGVPVSIAGPVSATKNTDANGVASFADLPWAAYTVFATLGSQAKSLLVLVAGPAVASFNFLSPVASFTFSPASPSVGQAVSFDGSASHDPDGSIVSSAWDFGDGTAALGLLASHAYLARGTFPVSLTVTDDSGLVATATGSVTVVAVDITVPVSRDDGIPLADVVVAIDGPVRLSLITGPTGTVAFRNVPPGVYAVSATLVGQTKSRSVAATADITVPFTFTRPIASFTFTPASPSVNQAVSFDGTASVDPDGVIAAVQWNFGDGSVIIGSLTAQHTYAATGTFRVTLTVADQSGLSNTAFADITVTAPGAVRIPSRVVPNVAAAVGGLQVSGVLKRAGDIDGDGSITITDIASVAFSFGFRTGNPRYDLEMDMDFDGDVDIVDISVAAFWFGKPGIPAGSLNGQTLTVEALIGGVWTAVASTLTAPGTHLVLGNPLSGQGVFSVLVPSASLAGATAVRVRFAGNATLEPTLSPAVAIA